MQANDTMNSILRTALVVAIIWAAALLRSHADFFDFLKPKGASSPDVAAPALQKLSQSQMVDGLKEALGKGVQQAVAALGKPDGFLNDLKVKIPMPAGLEKVEKTLRTLRQDKLADEFVVTMNRAAEQAVPEAAAVLADSVKQMNIADAKSILTGTNNAATEYFQRTSRTNLHARFLPIVQSATEKAGVTGSYKRMTEKVGGRFAGLTGNLLGAEMPNLDEYVTAKALDGLFLKVAEQEKLIRENPLARTSDLLRKVFGSLGN